jgi:colanic acid biosynthesis protein WcaH
MSTSEKTQFISQALYDQITKSLPIVSVEAVIKIDDALLFLKRNNQPAKGEWWFPGGRIHLGESLEETLRREVKHVLKSVRINSVTCIQDCFPNVTT